MTETVESKCIAPNCSSPVAINSALCILHKERLQRVEDQILHEAGKKIRRELRQFERLMYMEDTVTLAGKSEFPRPLTVEDIAHRMVWPMKKVRQMLRKFKDDRA